MISLKKITLAALITLTSLPALLAQPTGGGRPPGGGPEEMLSREKQALYEQVANLTDDQKVLIDGIYDEFGTTLKEAFEESRGSGGREARREAVRTLREEKDGLMADVLDEEQYATYTKLTAHRGRRAKADEPE